MLSGWSLGVYPINTQIWCAGLDSCNLLFKGTLLIYKGSNMSAHVLLNLLNELEKRDKMRGMQRFYCFLQQV